MITAIAISGVAAYYSIVGLTAIFSGVFLPIIIMGTALEVGKIVTTVWLHVYWHRIGWFIRSYLSFAVLVLMFITSMGIFGFLSRAHIDATSSIGDNALIIQQLDQQIDVERQRITDSQRVIAQMDQAVNNILSQSANERTLQNQRGGQIATQANQLRNQQRNERVTLNKNIDEANQRIAEINAQKLKLQQAQSKIEAEVGPVKYIAQLIYGDDVNKDLLERAVRWVIIIIVAVFDPLAVCLVLAVTMSIVNRRGEHNETSQRKNGEEVKTGQNDSTARAVATPNSMGTDTITTAGEGQPSPGTADPIIQYIDRPIIEYKTIEVEKIVEVPVEKEVIQTITIEKPVEVIKEVEVVKEIRVEDTDRMIELAREIDNLLGELKHKEATIGQLKAQIDVLATPNQYTLVETTIGKNFPAEPITGQLFCRPQQGSLSVFKWNGEQWLPVDKNISQSYLADDAILNGIVILLAEGQLTWEGLSDSERESIAPLIEDNPRFGRQ